MKGIPWTKEEERSLREILKGGASYADVARAMQERHGRRFTVHSVSCKASKLGLRLGGSDDPRPIPERAREEALRGELKRARGDLKSALLTVAALQDVRDHLAAACVAIDPLPREFKAPKAWRSRTRYDAVACVGDWQIGERIKPEQTDGAGEYDLKIAERRVEEYCGNLVKWLEAHRTRWSVRDLRIPVLGDMVSGDIHEELRRHNEFPMPVAAVKAGEMLADLAVNLAPHAERVFVEIVGADNHGRLTERLQLKEGAFNNWNYVTYEVARARLARHEGVTVDYLPSPITKRAWPGGGVLLMHGHQVRAWMGIPFYGIQRLQGRKAQEELQRALDAAQKALGAYWPWREMIMGHWHVPARLPRCIINGCLPGTSEYDQFAGRSGKPNQTSFIWSPEHGPFNLTEWTLV